MVENVHLIKLAKKYIDNTFDESTKQLPIIIPSFYNENEIIPHFLDGSVSKMQIILDLKKIAPPIESLIPGQTYLAEIIPIKRDVHPEECLEYLFYRKNVFIGVYGLLCILRWCYYQLFSIREVGKYKSSSDVNRIYLLDHGGDGHLRLFNGAPLAFSGPYRYEGETETMLSCITYQNQIGKGASLFCLTKLA